MNDPQTHFELQQLISRYVWALDTGDVEGACGLFTPQALFQDTAGNRYEGVDAIRAYFTRLTGRPDFRGRQHHVDHCLYTREGQAVRCRAYWTVTQWHTAQNRKELAVVGHSSDLFVRNGGDWRFEERVLHHWRDTDCPWKG
jgi:uncharacterized protein (TIGR02246 family)